MTEQPSASAGEQGAAAPPPHTPPTYAPPPYTPPSYTQPYAPPTARPPFRRSSEDRVIAGVCGGIGRTLGIDPLIPRIILAVLTLFGGLGLLFYVVAWLFVPEDSAPVSAAEGFAQRNGRLLTVVLAVIGAVVLLPITFGGLWFMGEWGPWGGIGFGPLLIVAVIAGIVWLALRDRDSSPPTTPVSYGPHGEPSTAPSAATQQTPHQQQSWSAQTGWQTTPAPVRPAATPPYTPPPAYAAHPAYATPSTYSTPPAYAPPPAYAARPGTAYGAPPSPPYQPPQPYVPPPPRRRRERSILGVLTLSAAALTAGVLWLLELADVIEIDAIVYPASILAVIALGLLVGGVFGRARWLVVFGIPLVFVSVALGHIGTWGNGEIGERRWNPSTLTEAEGPWELGIGEARLDLTGVVGIQALSEDLEVDAELGLGDLQVFVPADVPLTVNAEAGLGDIRVISPSGRSISEDGADVSFNQSFGDTSEPTIVLDIQIGAGQVEVIREAA